MTAESRWRQMMQRSFSPSQWFVTDDGPPRSEDGPTSTNDDQGRKMYVYRRTEGGVWTVGFYSPDGVWNPESDWDSPEDAAARVRWLHGGQ